MSPAPRFGRCRPWQCRPRGSAPRRDPWRSRGLSFPGRRRPLRARLREARGLPPPASRFPPPAVKPATPPRPPPDRTARTTDPAGRAPRQRGRSEEHTSELQSPCNLVCRLLLEKKKKQPQNITDTE